jgi:hypothetical protein
MSNESPASILFDESGNPVGIVFDGVVYRLQTQTIVTDGYNNGPVAIKPPFTAAESSDPAFVVAISPNNSFTVSSAKSGTNTTSSVPASLTSVTLLVENSTRLGATIFNDSSTGLLYIKLGTTASISDFTIKLYPSSYYEVPYGYTGEIDAIWSITGGHARIGEFTQ